jgi:signal transduction histidine kinase
MRAERISGLKLTPGVAVNFRSILLEGDFVKVLRVFTRARTQPSHSSTVQMRLNHPRRGLVWIEAVFTNLLHQPDVNAIVVNFRDITRRVNDEIKLQQLNDDLSTLMYRASHDIRGPLASILGVVQVGIDESKDLASGHYFHLVKNSAQRLDILLSELLQAMQIKERQLSPRLVDWESLIHDAEIAAQEGLPTPLKPKEVIFSTKIDPTVKPFSTDIPVLTLLITHLVQNSIEYREVTRSKCEVLVEVTLDRVKGIRICVTDNGIGIPDEIARHAFDMFVRGNVGKPGGGLGLYIVRTAAERLGGRVSLSSKVGEGTVVEVELPSINEV